MTITISTILIISKPFLFGFCHKIINYVPVNMFVELFVR